MSLNLQPITFEYCYEDHVCEIMTTYM